MSILFFDDKAEIHSRCCLCCAASSTAAQPNWVADRVRESQRIFARFGHTPPPLHTRWRGAGLPHPTTERSSEISAPLSRKASAPSFAAARSEEHTSELQSLAYLVCRLLLEKKKKKLTVPTMWT